MITYEISVYRTGRESVASEVGFAGGVADALARLREVTAEWPNARVHIHAPAATSDEERRELRAGIAALGLSIEPVFAL